MKYTFLTVACLIIFSIAASSHNVCNIELETAVFSKLEKGGLKVSPESSNAESEGNIIILSVQADTTNWHAVIDKESTSWITLGERSENSQNLIIKFNNSGSKREGKITFRLNNLKKTITVSQREFESGLAARKWHTVVSLQPDLWYGTAEAKEVAENVLLYQRDIGGWPKNMDFHKILNDSEKKEILVKKSSNDATFDNGATTVEMKFLGKMYSKWKDERYKMAVTKALDFIIQAQYGSSYAGEGGWPMFYPLRPGYHSRITFNDNAMTNLLRVLRDVQNKTGAFETVVDQKMAFDAKESYDKGVQCILKCQVTESGVKTFWCAQYDENNLLPACGRPHEMPSYSGSEGADIFRFLMEIENPSPEVKTAVVAAAEWLDKSKIPNKEVVAVTVNGKVIDRKVVDSPGNSLWGRFIQIGGKIGQQAHENFVGNYLKNSSKNGIYYKDNVSSSYIASNAGNPIFSIYDVERPIYLYRHFYIYEDAPPINGVPVSLDADTRKSYQFLGSWPQDLLQNKYPGWKAKNKL